MIWLACICAALALLLVDLMVVKDVGSRSYFSGKEDATKEIEEKVQNGPGLNSKFVDFEDPLEREMVCSSTINELDYTIEVKNIYTYQKDTPIYKDEVTTVFSTEEDLVNKLKDTLYEKYESYSGIEGITIEQYMDNSAKDIRLYSNLHVRYDKVDTTSLLEVDPSSANIMLDGEYSMTKIQALNESNGYTCNRTK